MTSGPHHRRGAPGCTGTRGGDALCSCERLGLVPEELPQLELDLHPIVAPEYVTGATIQERFEAFHALNPWVLEAFERLTADWLARGRKRIGMKMLAEVVRWQHGRATKGDTFKINNTHVSRYVRLMIERHPEWADVFETRELKTA